MTQPHARNHVLTLMAKIRRGLAVWKEPVTLFHGMYMAWRVCVGAQGHIQGPTDTTSPTGTDITIIIIVLLYFIIIRL